MLSDGVLSIRIGGHQWSATAFPNDFLDIHDIHKTQPWAMKELAELQDVLLWICCIHVFSDHLFMRQPNNLRQDRGTGKPGSQRGQEPSTEDCLQALPAERPEFQAIS